MKPIFIILFSLCLFKTFGQVDSQLQHLIDSAKASQAVQAATKDSTREVTPKKIVKKDSTRAVSIIPDSSAQPGIGLQTNTQPSVDSLKQDSARRAAMIVIPKKPLYWQQDTAFANLMEIFIAKPGAKALLMDGDFRVPKPKDYLFYLLVGIVLLLALIKQLFPKYFQNLFRLLFQASFRQKQTREQLMQEIFPSLLMNILFVLVGGVFIALLADIHQWLDISFWWITMYSITLLALIYMMKYIVVKFMGWVFNATEQASTYGFIVFFANKVIGIALLPLVLLVAFSEGMVQQIAITVSFFVIVILVVFRYIISLTIIRNTLSIHPLHFFVYLCGVELMPILIIYKILFDYMGKSN